MEAIIKDGLDNPDGLAIDSSGRKVKLIEQQELLNM